MNSQVDELEEAINELRKVVVKLSSKILEEEELKRVQTSVQNI